MHTEKEPANIDNWLMEGLLFLMAKKPYEKISVKNIVDKAQLARCTFYRHFKNKDELLLACCKKITSNLSEQLTEDNIESFYGTALTYFSFWKEHQDFLALLRKNDLLYFFLRSYDNFMFDVSKAVKYDSADLDGFDFSPKIRYHFFYGMNGLWGIANRWTMYGCKESPEELAQYVVAFFVESYENEPDCQFYKQHGAYPYEPCYIKPDYEF